MTNTATLSPPITSEPADASPAPGRRRLPSPAERNMLVSLANDVAGSGVQGTHTPSAAFAKLLVGFEHGLPPGTAMNEIKLIDGRLTLPEMVAVAAIRSSGIGDIRTVEVAADHATVAVTRADWPAGREERVTYTVADALQAGLIMLDASGKNISRKDNWRKSAPQMMLARARAEARRRFFEEEAAGLSYSPDELGADTDEDGRLIEPMQLNGAAAGVRTVPPPAPPPATEQPPALSGPAADFAQPAGEPVPPAGVRQVKPVPPPPPPPLNETTTQGPPPPTPAEQERKARVAEVARRVALLNLTREQWHAILHRFGSPSTSTLMDLDDATQAIVADHVATLHRIEQLRALTNITDQQWQAALQRRSVAHLSELQPADATEIHDKLAALATPFDRQKLGIRTNGNNGGTLAGKPSTPSPAPAPLAA